MRESAHRKRQSKKVWLPRVILALGNWYREIYRSLSLVKCHLTVECKNTSETPKGNSIRSQWMVMGNHRFMTFTYRFTNLPTPAHKGHKPSHHPQSVHWVIRCWHCFSGRTMMMVSWLAAMRIQCCGFNGTSTMPEGEQ